MIRRNTSKGGWELLYKGLAVELENTGIDVSHGKTNAVKEFLAVCYSSESINKSI
jgi:hypothetical protein